MTIEIISCWYNETFLAPYFLRHYSCVDRITILLDMDAPKQELDLSAYPNLHIFPLYFSAKMNEKEKVDAINNFYRHSKADYVINVDADEFVFCDRKDFDNVEWDIARVNFAMVFRNSAEHDLNTIQPVKEQRQHGVYLWPSFKPIIARTGMDLQWLIGNHQIKVNGVRESFYEKNDRSDVKYRSGHFQGAHWANADPCFAIDRRLERQDRQSKFNLSRHYSNHNHGIMRKMLEKEYAEHINDPKVW